LCFQTDICRSERKAGKLVWNLKEGKSSYMRDIAWKVFHYSPSFIMTKTQLMCWLLGLYTSVKYFLCHRATFCCVLWFECRFPSVLHDISLYGKGFPQLFISGVICTFYRFHCNLIMLLHSLARSSALLRPSSCT
jgi:hypothetical protein